MNVSLISEREAAALGLTAACLRKWRQRRCGPPFVRLSPRCVRYRIADLERFVAERAITPRDASAGVVEAQ